MDRDTLVNVARTSLRTKLHPELADLLTEVRTGIDHHYIVNKAICHPFYVITPLLVHNLC